MSDVTKWHAEPVERVLPALGSSYDGLSHQSDLPLRRKRFGDNTIPQQHVETHWQRFVKQLASPLIIILIAAAAIAVVLGELKEAIIVLVVILMNALIGWRQDHSAFRAVQALLSQAPQDAHVLRDGYERLVPWPEVVVGDILLVTAGDVIAADGRWISAEHLRVNESSLTGESVPLDKQTEPRPVTTSLHAQDNMAWRGTAVVTGRGRMVVTTVGGGTRYGQIVQQLLASSHHTTPLQAQLHSFARTVIWIASGVGIVVAGLGLLRGMPGGEVLLLSLSMIVSIVPEGLPMVMTLAMSAGMTAMARRKVIARNLLAIETMGHVTTVATDKTGTVTYGEMMVEKIWVSDGRYEVSGRGYEPTGEIQRDGRSVLGGEHHTLAELLRIGVLNNDARFSLDEAGQPLPLGDPTELALLVAAQKSQVVVADVQSSSPRRGEVPFDSATKMMLTWHDHRDHHALVTLKGAPQSVLGRCQQIASGGQVRAMTEADQVAIRQTYEQWATEAYRVLAFGYQVAEIDQAEKTAQDGTFVFVGLMALADAVRPESKDTILTLLRAGIRTILLTGDGRATGQAIAQRIGLLTPPVKEEALLDGEEMRAMNEQALRSRLPSLSVATRLFPEQKQHIIQELQRHGEVVAMTGDGVNDVLGLASADVGIAVGRQSSDAVKQASGLVLVDGNYAHLASAIREGRRMKMNIRRAVIYLVASSAGELVLLLTSLIAGTGLPLLATHIIWLNVVTGSFLGVALAHEPASPNLMRLPPEPRDQPLLAAPQWRRMVVLAVTIGLSGFALYYYGQSSGRSVATVFAMTVSGIAIAEWAAAWTVRVTHRSLASALLTNPYVIRATLIVILLHTFVIQVPFFHQAMNWTGLTLTEWGLAALTAVPVIIIDELRKVIFREPIPHHHTSYV